METNQTLPKRYEPIFHFVLLPLLMATALCAAYLAGGSIGEAQWAEGLFYLLVPFTGMATAAVIYLYRTQQQARLLRLELRVRYRETFGETLKGADADLSGRHITVLLSASDDVFAELFQQAVDEKLPPEEIFRRIQNTSPDLKTV